MCALPKMADVARAAGVAQATVSRVLKNHPNVSPATRMRVQQAVQNLNYRPNPLISTLMADLKARRGPGSSTVIAYLTPHYGPKDVEWQHFLSYYEGARHRAESLGFQIEHFQVGERGMGPERLDKILYTRNIQGVLIAPSPRPHKFDLKWENFALATVCYTLREPHLSVATSNHYGNMLIALRNLRRLGYRKIGFIIDSQNSHRVLDLWLGGFMTGQLFLPEKERLPALAERQLSPTRVGRWFKKWRPDAVICSGMQEMNLLRDMDPDVFSSLGVALLNLSDRYIAQINAEHPKFAGIAEFHHHIGASTIDLIIGQLHRNERGLPSHPKLTLIEGLWKDGESARRIGDPLPFSSE